MLQKVGINITSQEDGWSIELVTSDTTPHLYAKVVVGTFDCYMWIIMIP
jgi:hypothetical protein